MKYPTDEEIWKKLQELWPDTNDHSRYGNEKTIHRNAGALRFRVTRMYDWDPIPALTLDKRLALSEFFDTMNVEHDGEVSEGGCETCDYGSEYGFEVLVRPGASYDPAIAAALEPSPRQEGV
jgi:hypothetical protein